jgi:hypothetical protein
VTGGNAGDLTAQACPNSILPFAINQVFTALAQLLNANGWGTRDLCVSRAFA